MKTIRLISCILIGIVFMFSGITKAIDPLGSAYKFHDYFVAFNMTWLDFMSLPLAIFMCAAEFISGFAVISSIRKKEGMLGVSLLMIIFTPLTLVLAITNPVTDCGCFGDAIHLTNWQTFWKNVILAILTVIVITGRRYVAPVSSTAKEWKLTGAIVALFVLFCIGNLRYLPLIDFLPYKKDVRIADQMIIPEGAEPDKYSTTFIYEKNGEQKEFTLENYPADDTTWVFVDQKSTLVEQGYQPPIHDFAITTLDGIDITNQILADTGYTLLMVSKKLEETDTVRLQNGFNTGQLVQNAGISFYILTATSSDKIPNRSNSMQFCTADETTLKTMLRANPGYMLIHNGTITGKWSTATLPEAEWFKSTATGTDVSQGNRARVPFVVFSILAALFTALLATAVNIKRNF